MTAATPTPVGVPTEPTSADRPTEVDVLLDEGFHCGQIAPINAAAHKRVCCYDARHRW